ncbi:MAG: U32 family peptidase [Bacillales bacterium]|jgi:putative protease|nr:U32 family peptidase [Bacillales bacterium]
MRELLAPAGDLTRLKVALLYGADAVYIGGKLFSLRSTANNFSINDLKKGLAFAHKHHKKVYLTINSYVHERDMNKLDKYLNKIKDIGIDALIVSNLGVLTLANKYGFTIHLSTQMSIINSEAINFLSKYNVKRVVLGREVSLKEINIIKEKTNVELEVFIHGGMCSAYSGRCTLSNNMSNRDANRGGCAHCCRWEYHLYSKNGELISKDNISIGSKDLNTFEIINNIKADSLKVEGRMKSINYIATVIRNYRLLLDGKSNVKDCLFDLKYAESRETTQGFLGGEVRKKDLIYNLNDNMVNQNFIGMIESKHQDMYKITSKNNFSLEEPLLVIGYDGSEQVLTDYELFDETFMTMNINIHPGSVIYLKTSMKLKKYFLVRKLKKL